MFFSKNGVSLWTFCSCFFTLCSILLFHILFLSRFLVSTNPWNSFQKSPKDHHLEKVFLHTPIPLSLCLNHEKVMRNTKYAIVSLFSGNFALYGVSATKLARSITSFTSVDKILMVLNTTTLLPNEKNQFVKEGWKVCIVQEISNPITVKKNNRFLEAKLYSKFNAWKLIEYEAVLFLDSDTLAVGNPATAFTHELPIMKEKNKTLAATRDMPFSTCRFGIALQFFNAGVLLLIPNLNTFEELKTSISTVHHDTDWAEQDLLNVLFYNQDYSKSKRSMFHELPFEYNANVIAKVCEPTLWHSKKSEIKIIHYTTAKGWMYSQHWQSLKDPFECWWWNVQDLCLLWENT